MFSRALLCLLLGLLVLTFVSGAEAGRRRRHRDPRVYDTRPSDRHDDDDDDDDDHERDDDRDDERRDEKRDREYDHKAFLGKESEKYDDMSPAEAKEKLAALLEKIDKNNDTRISLEEMQDWLKRVAKQERIQAAESRFHNIKATANSKDLDAPLTMAEYEHAIHQEIVGDDTNDKTAQEAYNTQLVRDKARWAKADADGDKLLNKTEFANFQHPEEAPSMREIVIQETMMNTDKNKDGKVDLTEFMKDLHPDYEKDLKEKKKLPDWVVAEEKQFKEKLDVNKDGVLDPNEVYKWIVPDDFDHSIRETKHLFKVADANKDNFLSKDEVMNKWDTFVGHQATDFGNFRHEEL